MLVIYRDPRGISGREVYEMDYSVSLQQNIERQFPRGLDADVTVFRLNGQQINPLTVSLSRRATQLDTIEVIIRQQSSTALIIGAIAAAAAIVVIALTPRPNTPNDVGERKDSPNNDLTGQSNIARLYQAIPDIYGKVRVFPDLTESSLIEYINNIKNITEMLCIGIGYYRLENLKFADTLLSTINGASYQIFQPGDVIPLIYSAMESADVDGQEITPPNLADSVLYSAETYTPYTHSAQGKTMTFNLAREEQFAHFLDKSKPITVGFTLPMTYQRPGSNPVTANYNFDGTLTSMTDDGTSYHLTISNIALKNDYAQYPTGGVIQPTYFRLEDKEALYVGPFVLGADGDQIWYNIVFLRGLMDSDGDKRTASFTSEWWKVDAYGNAIPGTEGSESFSYTDSTYDGLYFTRKVIPAAGYGRYAFRIKRTSNGAKELTDQAKLEEVFAIKTRHNVAVQHTMVKCITTATEQATGFKDRKFNAEVTRKTITWQNGQIVSTLAPSRDFADAVLHSFVQIAGRNPDELDLPELYDISRRLKETNEQLGWFDFSFDDKDISLGQRMQTICNVARVAVFRDGLKWRFARDERKDFVTAQFDARNLANDDTGGSLQYRAHMPTSFDGIELEWVNASDTNDDGTDKKAYIQLRIDSVNRVIVEGPATRPNKIQLAGCRNHYQAMNRAQLEARRLIYQRLAVEDTALSDANFVQIGDRVRWADVYDESLCSGEIMHIDGTTFYTSESMPFIEGQTYRVSITDAHGYPSPWIPATTDVHDNTIFKADFTGAYTADGINSMLGSRFIITPTVATEPMEFLLTGKSAGDGDNPTQLKISLSQYDERMYEFDT